MQIYTTYSVKIKHYNNIFKDTVIAYRHAVISNVTAQDEIPFMQKSPPKLFLSPKFYMKIGERIFVGENIGKISALVRGTK